MPLTGGNRHDVTQFLPLLDAVPPIPGLPGRPRHRPRRLYADRGYGFDKYRRLLWKRGIRPLIARCGTAHGSGLGKVRWGVERAFAWLHQFHDSAPATSDTPTSTWTPWDSPAASSASDD